MFSIFPVIYIFGRFVSVVSFRSFRFGRFVSVVSAVPFRSFRFDVSPFSTCRPWGGEMSFFISRGWGIYTFEIKNPQIPGGMVIGRIEPCII